MPWYRSIAVWHSHSKEYCAARLSPWPAVGYTCQEFESRPCPVPRPCETQNLQWCERSVLQPQDREGESNELCSHSMLPKDHFKQIVNLFKSHYSKVTIGNFWNQNYALVVDFRSIPDDSLHSSGRPLQRLSDGITFHITKRADIRKASAASLPANPN